uniref:molybdopterin-dependent oxidoreductase n=1 Tax=Ruania albidiflava TaxID=366586 RepID=UPI0023F0AFDF
MTRRTRTASHWGSYWVTTDGGEVTGVEPVAQDPSPSAIGDNFRGTLRGRTRITRPAVREGWLRDGPGAPGRGSDGYVEVAWEKAIALVAGEIDRVRSAHGNSAIYGSSYGWGSAGRFHHAQSQLHRFLNTVGGYTRSVTNYSFAAEAVLLPHVVGDRDWLVQRAPRWSQVETDGQYVLAFGGLPRSTAQVSSGGVGAHVSTDWQVRCARAGVQFTIVTPSRTDSSADLAAEWLPARPGTDVALMLGLCHELLVTGRYDRDFLERCCTGFEQVRAYLLGEQDGAAKTAAWAAEICDLPEAAIRQIADRIATMRTLVTVTWSMQRQQHGEMSYWAAITLAAMSGSMGRPGGGFSPGVSSMHSAHVYRTVSALAALPQGQNPVPDFIPVARLNDMLLHPGEEFDFDGGRYRYPEIRLVYWAGGNPFHHHQDLNTLLRAWRAPDTVVVHEPYWNAMAKHADIVIPVATALEREDIAFGAGDRWVSYCEPAARGRHRLRGVHCPGPAARRGRGVHREPGRRRLGARAVPAQHNQVRRPGRGPAT